MTQLIDRPPPRARIVTLVLCLADGRVLGALPPLRVDSPWWPDVADVVTAARRTHLVEVTVLRLLTARLDATGQGGPVAYLAQVDTAPEEPLGDWPGDPVGDMPHRLPYARPGGPATDLAWADSVLAARGIGRIGPAEQMRTWNLSSIWRLPTGAGPAWLKVVPPFFAHEGAMLGRLAPGIGPRLLGAADGRVLMADVPGEDQYDAPVNRLLPVIRVLVALQADWIGRVAELLALGLPDWRPAPLTALAAATIRRAADQLDAATTAMLDSLIGGLPERFAAIAACGIPHTLVHGDFHPGNVRRISSGTDPGPGTGPGTANGWVLLDWGDCGVGHPLLDQTAFLSRQAAAAKVRIRAEWARLWRAAVPGSDPDRAAALIEPVAALRQAVIYHKFLDNIEADERVYHAGDPAFWLRRAAALSG